MKIFNIFFFILFVLLLSFNNYSQIVAIPMDKTDTTENIIIKGYPANYPKDIPAPLNSKCKGYIESLDGIAVTFESPERPKIIYETFKSEIEKIGYVEDSLSKLMQDSGGVASWKKVILDDQNKYERTLTVCWNKGTKLTDIVITYRR